MTAVRKIDVRALIHQAMHASLADVAQQLEDTLGRPLTAFLTGVRDPQAVTRWATGHTEQLRDPEIERRVREAFVICELLLAVGEAPATIRTWFIGMNPELYDEAPVEAIRAGRLREVRGAALAFAGGA